MIDSGFSLRVATPADAAAVSNVLAASYSVLYRGWYRDDILDKALPAMTRARPELLASGRYFVVQHGGDVVSCGGWSSANPRGGTDAAKAHIRHFGTHPDFLNRGAAGAIMRRCLEDARAANFPEIECLSSLAAEAFYMKHGFDTAAPTTVTIGGAPFACMLMRRGL